MRETEEGGYRVDKYRASNYLCTEILRSAGRIKVQISFPRSAILADKKYKRIRCVIHANPQDPVGPDVILNCIASLH